MARPLTRHVPAAQERAVVAAISRHRPNDLEALTEARRALKVARAEDYIKKLVDEAPPLTAGMRDRLASLLRGGAAA